MKVQKALMLSGVAILALIVVSCAPNNQRFVADSAGFWAGLWHGFIIVITFVISLFSDNVTVYEINNTGGWYNFGFLLGLIVSLGHGGIWHPVKKQKRKSECEKEWEEIGAKVEDKVKRGIRSWVDEEEEGEKDWEEIGKKVEEKIKRELRKWAEK